MTDDANIEKWHDKLMEESKLFWVVQTGTISAIGLMWGWSAEALTKLGSNAATQTEIMTVICLASLFLSLLSISYVIASASFIFQARVHLGVDDSYDGGSAATILLIGHYIASAYFAWRFFNTASWLTSLPCLALIIGLTPGLAIAVLGLRAGYRKHSRTSRGKSFLRTFLPL